MTAAGDSAQRWWRSPFRVVQTNIREPDAAMDVPAIGQDILDTGANAWLLNTAGIVSFHPTALDYRYPTPFLAERASGDLNSATPASGAAGTTCASSRASTCQRRTPTSTRPTGPGSTSAPKGSREIYNGLYSTCMNGPYYTETGAGRRGAARRARGTPLRAGAPRGACRQGARAPPSTPAKTWAWDGRTAPARARGRPPVGTLRSWGYARGREPQGVGQCRAVPSTSGQWPRPRCRRSWGIAAPWPRPATAVPR